jgi:hypothetical protein
MPDAKTHNPEGCRYYDTSFEEYSGNNLVIAFCEERIKATVFQVLNESVSRRASDVQRSPERDNETGPTPAHHSIPR